MADLFVDTAGWGNLVDPSQQFHRLAAEIYRNARQHQTTLLTSNYVIAELVALLTSPVQVPRARIISFVDSLKEANHVEIVHVDAELDERAWRLLKEREDKDWSLVDGASFVIMKERRMTDALTSDHHFEQAGFQCLLK